MDRGLALPPGTDYPTTQATRTDSDLLGIDRVRRYADPEARAESLPALQRRLLTKAFGVLRAGGVLLYVTCSSEAAQARWVLWWGRLSCSAGLSCSASRWCVVQGAADAIRLSRLWIEAPGLARVQGEKIIEWFLASTPEATLERVETHGVQARRVGEAGAMVRFSPTVSATSGLFVCRLGRRA